MKVTYLEVSNFKRFTNLKINLRDLSDAKLVVLVGPNGCGKSSVFDIFEQIGCRSKPGRTEDNTYLRKDVNSDWLATIESDLGSFSKTILAPMNSFYLRSSYRHDPDFHTSSIQTKDELIKDTIRPKKMIDLDKRVQDNYERLIGTTVKELYSQNKDNLSVPELREELIGEVKRVMQKVFPDLILEGVGNPLINGQFLFTKGSSKNFPYKNLSSGEKGAFDILLDLIIKTKEFDNTVIAIDEPELHMHSSLQRNLLKETYRITPETCQIWVATHSIGFIRGALELFRADPSKVAILDFTNKNFDVLQEVKPIESTPQKIREIFTVAIEDLAEMVTPSKIIICEGSRNAPADSLKKEFDKRVYDKIFSGKDVLFISGDNKTSAQKSGELLFKIIKEAGSIKEIYSVVDRDDLTEEEIKSHKSQDATQLFLSRRSIENYLLSSEIIDLYCSKSQISKEMVTSKVQDELNGDAKARQSSIMQQCGYQGRVEDFLLELADYIKPETLTYLALKSDLGL